MTKVKLALLNGWKRNIFSLIVFLLGIVIPLGFSVVFAVPPATSYNPGETLDPSCSPGDTNCYINGSVYSYFYATSTTATSTFAGGLSVAGASGLSVLQNGNVGVGTVSPETLLHIVRDGSGQPGIFLDRYIDSPTSSAGFLGRRARGSATSPTQTKNGDWIFTLSGRGYTDSGDFGITSTGLLGFRASEDYTSTAQGQDIFFQTAENGTRTLVERMTILNNGNIGIGTTTPSSLLYVNGDITSGSINATIGNPNSTFYAIQLVRPNYNMFSTGGFGFGFNSSTYPWLSILDSGNVGIGTTSPYAKLSVAGESLAGYFTATTTTATSTFAGGLSVAGASGLSVLQNGYVGVGTITPRSLLEVGNGTTNRGVLNIVGTPSGVHHAPVISLSDTAVGGRQWSLYSGWTNAGYFDLFDQNANASRLTIDTNGYVGIGTTTPNSTLDVNGKVSIGDSVTTARLNSGTPGGNSPRALSLIDSSGVARIWRFTNNISTGPSVEMIWGNDNDVANNKWWDFYLNPDDSWQIRRRTGGAVTTVPFAINSSGYVGIGTTSPYAKLSVAGESLAGYFTATTTTATSTFAGGLSVAGSSGLTVLQNGYVGVGTNNPVSKMHFSTDGGDTKIIADAYSGSSSKTIVFAGRLARGTMDFPSGVLSGDTLMSFGGRGYGTTKFSAGSGSRISFVTTEDWTDSANGAKIDFYTTPNSYSYVSEALRMTISDNGNVGIGTTSPYAKLSVAGESLAGYFTATTTTATSTFEGGLSVAGTSGLTVLQNGYVGVGTTSPSTQFEVNGSSAGITLDRTGSLEPFIQFKNSGSALGQIRGVVGNGLKFTSGSSLVEWARIDGNGKMMLGTTSPSNGSDLTVWGSGSINNTRFINASGSAPGLSTMRARGTADSPLPVLADDNLLEIIAGGYHSGGSFSTNSVAGIEFNAAENFTSTNQGTYLSFQTTKIGETTRDERVRISSSGNVGIGTTSPYAKLSVAGESLAGYFTATTTTATSTFAGNLYVGNKILVGETVPLIGSNLSVVGGATFSNTTEAWNFADPYIYLNSDSNYSYITQNSSGKALQIRSKKTGGTLGVDMVLKEGNVGIGTTSPYAKLSVAGAVGGTTDLFSVSTTTSASSMGNAFVIKPNGQIGIGTNDPQWGLHVQSIDQNGATAVTIETPPNGNSGIGSAELRILGIESRIVTQNNTRFFIGDNGPGQNPGLWMYGRSSGYGDKGSWNLHAGQLNEDVLAHSSDLIGLNAYSSASTNLVGGDLNITAGSGASGSSGNAKGGDVVVLGGIGYGTGMSGNVLLSSTRGNVGIGTTSPYAKLSVAGESLAGYFTATTTTATSTFAGGLSVAGTSGLTVLQNGYVGIGTTSPTKSLEVYYPSTDTTIRLGGYSVNSGIGLTDLTFFNAGSNIGVDRMAQIQTLTDVGKDTGQIRFSIKGSATDTVLTQALVIRYGGNVGIGTTSPYAKLSVAGETVTGYFTATTTTATSTIAGNLDVLGTLHAQNSYTGDLIFANNFRFTEGMGDPKYLYLNNQDNNNLLTINENGNVGIGNQNPSYKLEVTGDIGASSFVNISTKNAKKNINYLTDSDYYSYLDKLKDFDVATYKYKTDSEEEPLRLGIIAEDAPAEVLSASGEGVDLYKLTAFTLGAVKAEQNKIEELNARFDNIQKLISSLGTTSQSIAGTTNEGFISFLESLGTKIVDGLVSVKNIVVEKLTIGNEGSPTEVTVYDKNGKAGCMTIDDVYSGTFNIKPGACGSEEDPVVTTTTTTTATTTSTTTTTGDVVDDTGNGTDGDSETDIGGDSSGENSTTTTQDTTQDETQTTEETPQNTDKTNTDVVTENPVQ